MPVITPEQYQVYQRLWNQAVEDGDAEGHRRKLNAGYWVAYCLANRDGGAHQDRAHAQQILDQALQQQTTGSYEGSGKHLYLLANIMDYLNYNEERVEELYRQAIPRLEMEVQQGGNDENYREAAFYLGNVHYFGHGLDHQDKPRGIHWWKNAAELGHVYAQSHIGCFCIPGPFVAEIVSWMQQIADQNNNVWAQWKLGVCHERGHGVKRDLVKAVEWYNKAIAQGDDRAVEFKQSLLWLVSPEERSKTLGCVARNQNIEKARDLVQQCFVGEVPLSLWALALASFQNQVNPPWEAPSPTFLSLKDAIMPQLRKQSKKQKRKRGLESSQALAVGKRSG